VGDIVIGLVSDTHVPDRVSNLHPGLLNVFRNAAVSQILHGGDVSDDAVLHELGRIAPVLAVQGNRDLLRNGNSLPATLSISVNGIKIGLFHGFGNMWLYFVEKFNFLVHGYQLSYYRNLVKNSLPDADVLVFGHTHRPENVFIDGQLVINPGSAGMGGWGYPPSCGILRVSTDGKPRCEIINLTGASLIGRQWV